MTIDPKNLNERAKAKVEKLRAVLPPVAARFKKQSLEQQTEEALENVPRITNETVAEHREKVLKGARKYKYPLQHSKHKIVAVTVSLIATALIGFIVAIALSLYKFQSTSSFVYHVTQILPFPVAKVDGQYVSYNSYLFDLRRFMYYYQTQQQVDFASESGKIQLEQYKPKALERAVQMVYVKRLAQQQGVSVSSAEINDAVATLRVQNHLASDAELTSVLKRFYDWSIDDFRRELGDELLAQKVAAKLDTQDTQKATQVLARVRAGEDFATLAGQYSDDTSTKTSGGQYTDTAIAMGGQEVSPIIVRQLSKMKAGDVSDVITTASSYEIVKLLEVSADGKYKAAHIQVNFRPISDYTKPLAGKATVKKYIHVQAPTEQVVPVQSTK